MPLPDASSRRPTPPHVEAQIVRAFAPLDKRALGVAMGVAGALVVAAVTMMSMLMDPAQRFPLALLAQYFAGYSVSVPGVFIGAAWAFATGFCWGWFIAFARNLMLSLWLLSVRVRADMATSRDVLDHL
jgi:hypothetical protein